VTPKTRIADGRLPKRLQGNPRAATLSWSLAVPLAMTQHLRKICAKIKKGSSIPAIYFRNFVISYTRNGLLVSRSILGNNGR
jgi:hypothetical protein